MRAMRSLGTLLVVAVFVVSCTGDGAGQTTTTSPDDTTSTTSVEATTTSTTTEVTTTSSTSSTPPTTTTTTTTTTGDPLAPEGSGCTPEMDVLPDGRWYGGVRAFDEQGIAFDLACLFVGDAAEAAAAEDGEESAPPNDYYVRNKNEAVRILAVTPDTPVTWYPSGDPNDDVTGTYPEWIEFLATQESYLGIWVTVESGAVTEITEWWVP